VAVAAVAFVKAKMSAIQSLMATPVENRTTLIEEMAKEYGVAQI
jgi:hypothetical protein